MPVLRTHAACALLEAAPCSAAGGPSSGSSSSRKTRAPNSPSSAPSATPASSPSSAKVDSMAALRTAGRGSSRTMSVRLCSSVHQSFCGTGAEPLRSTARYLSRRSAAWSEMLSWRCWDAYSHTHATHSTWWSPRSSPCSVITASTVEKPAFVTESASSEAASPSTASIGRQPERMLCARDCTMWPRQPRMSSLTPLEVLEGLEELALELVVVQLALFEKLHRELAQRVDGVERDAQVLVLPHLDEKLAEHLPDARPHEPHARHVIVGDLDDLLQRVNLRVGAVGQLLARDGAEVRHELDDGVGPQLRRGGEDPVDGDHVDLLDHRERVELVDEREVGLIRRLTRARPGGLDDGHRASRAPHAARGRTAWLAVGGRLAVGRGGRRGEEELRVRLGAGADHVQALALRDALEHRRPGRAEVVAVGERNVDERLEALDVAPAHGLGRLKVGVLCEHRHEGVALRAHVKRGCRR